MRVATACSILACLTMPAWAQDHQMIPSADQVKWGPAPPVFPKGAEFAVLAGDPGKQDLFVIRLKLPANYKIPAHTHPTDENVTVISGLFNAGMGDKLDMAKGVAFKPGGFAAVPANARHFAWTTEPTIVEVSAMGPFAMTYVDPKDDPSK
ncbi:MAG: anti-ECFsigma factor, ChrR [Hyphomicrobiales bacterium]|nr:anti-ECFsigma factor, ChrR [Hyphomicrobiales bacterium]